MVYSQIDSGTATKYNFMEKCEQTFHEILMNIDRIKFEIDS